MLAHLRQPHTGHPFPWLFATRRSSRFRGRNARSLSTTHQQQPELPPPPPSLCSLMKFCCCCRPFPVGISVVVCFRRRRRRRWRRSFAWINVFVFLLRPSVPWLSVVIFFRRGGLLFVVGSLCFAVSPRPPLFQTREKMQKNLIITMNVVLLTPFLFQIREKMQRDASFRGLINKCFSTLPPPPFASCFTAAVPLPDPREDAEVPVAGAGGAERAQPFHVPAHVAVPPAVGLAHQEGGKHQPPLEGHQEGNVKATGFCEQ